MSVIVLSDLVGTLALLEVRCRRCDRLGRMRVAGLIASHGPDYPVWQVMDRLAKGCPRLTEHAHWDRCSPYSPDLTRLPRNQPRPGC